MTNQTKKEKITPERFNQLMKERGLKPIPLVNQGPKRTIIRIIIRTRKSSTEEQPKDSDSQE